MKPKVLNAPYDLHTVDVSRNSHVESNGKHLSRLFIMFLSVWSETRHDLTNCNQCELIRTSFIEDNTRASSSLHYHSHQVTLLYVNGRPPSSISPQARTSMHIYIHTYVVCIAHRVKIHRRSPGIGIMRNTGSRAYLLVICVLVVTIVTLILIDSLRNVTGILQRLNISYYMP